MLDIQKLSALCIQWASTHYHPALHLNSDRQATDQAREWKFANPGTRGHAYSQGDVGSGKYAPSASYHIKPRTAS